MHWHDTGQFTNLAHCQPLIRLLGSFVGPLRKRYLAEGMGVCSALYLLSGHGTGLRWLGTHARLDWGQWGHVAGSAGAHCWGRRGRGGQQAAAGGQNHILL